MHLFYKLFSVCVCVCESYAELTFHNGITNVVLCNKLSTDGNKVASKKCMTCGQKLHNFKKKAKIKKTMWIITIEQLFPLPDI